MASYTLFDKKRKHPLKKAAENLQVEYVVRYVTGTISNPSNIPFKNH